MKHGIEILSAKELLEKGMPLEQLIEDFVRINREVWIPPFPQNLVWTPEKVKEQFKNCPEMQCCMLVNNVIVATLNLIYIDAEDALACNTWEDISGHGALSTHNPHGDFMFGIDLSVSPNFQGKKLSAILIKHALEVFVVEAGKKGCFLGSRIPRYAEKYKKNKILVHEYVFGKEGIKRKPMDPEIILYQKAGFAIVQIMENYIPDPESRNYGVLMLWRNPCI